MNSGPLSLRRCRGAPRVLITSAIRSRSYSDATERDDRTHDVFNRIVGHVLKGQGSGGSDLNLGDLAYDCASNVASRKL